MPATAPESFPGQGEVHQIFEALLRDFGVNLSNQGSKVIFTGGIAALEATKSERILLSLVGALPAAANALLAAQIFELRGGQAQTITVDLQRGHNYIDPNIGMNPTINGQEIPLDVVMGNPFLRNIYETKDGHHVVPSAVYVDLVYQWSSLFSCSLDASAIESVIKTWDADGKAFPTPFNISFLFIKIRANPLRVTLALEKVCAEAGMPLAVVRSESEWLATPPGDYLSKLPSVPTRKATDTAPVLLSKTPRRPLEGLKVLCMTHAIAGPSAGRTLAEHGASVLQIMYTHGFEHQFVYTYANLGCASSRLNLHKAQDRSHLWELVRQADVWIDSYRETALSKFGFDDSHLHEARPSLIISHVRAYGAGGPWEDRPGFDMQGSAVSGMMALCGDGPTNPAWPPGMVINDYTTGYYGALAIQAAVLRRIREGGGYILSPSLAGTAMSILKYFKTSDHPQLALSKTDPLPPLEIHAKTALGQLKTLKPLPVLSGTPIKYDPILLEPMGCSVPVFPGFESTYNIGEAKPWTREDFLPQLVKYGTRAEYLKRMGQSRI